MMPVTMIAIALFVTVFLGGCKDDITNITNIQPTSEGGGEIEAISIVDSFIADINAADSANKKITVLELDFEGDGAKQILFSNNEQSTSYTCASALELEDFRFEGNKASSVELVARSFAYQYGCSGNTNYLMDITGVSCCAVKIETNTDSSDDDIEEYFEEFSGKFYVSRSSVTGKTTYELRHQQNYHTLMTIMIE